MLAAFLRLGLSLAAGMSNNFNFYFYATAIERVRVRPSYVFCYFIGTFFPPASFASDK